ncbi:MAG TPA: fatty acid desaturase [Vicinamibacteria bacterium]|nr:fatty acid desaturase [Vicinamibacteria bacterium]
MRSNHHYWRSVQGFKQVLRDAIPHAELKALHVKRPALHLAYAARQFAIVAACSYVLWTQTSPWLWVPAALLQGFTFFNMTVLLHEVVHDGVFKRPRPALERALGLAYAITSGISASQFTRWHLDHHDNLGDALGDPKRHWLSPRRNARWYKLLYCTPALMPIYFRAAAREARSYPEGLRRTIARERLTTVVIQLAVATLLWAFGGPGAMLRAWLVPYFLVFPVAFTLNRLGQHYDIDPGHPLKWSTLMGPSRLWEFLFVYSNYHLEHHYFPRVPFYNLRSLHMKLRPLYAELGLTPRTYRSIVWQWFVLNRAPHTNWALSARPAGAAAEVVASS